MNNFIRICKIKKIKTKQPDKLRNCECTDVIQHKLIINAKDLTNGLSTFIMCHLFVCSGKLSRQIQYLGELRLQ